MLFVIFHRIVPYSYEMVYPGYEKIYPYFRTHKSDRLGPFT